MADYQCAHDLADRVGQAAGIDPKTGEVWLGESAVDIAQQRKTKGLISPLFLERIGSPTYFRKKGHFLTIESPTPDSQLPILD